jgi:hypothetical protein
MLVSSHRLHITRFPLTETADPELEPRDAARVLSYTLLGLPAQELR